MAYDKVVDSAVLDAGLKQIADAIRSKTGTSDNLTFPAAMAAAIAAIESGGGGGGTLLSGTVTLAEDTTTITEIAVGCGKEASVILLIPMLLSNLLTSSHNGYCIFLMGGTAIRKTTITQSYDYEAYYSNTFKASGQLCQYMSDTDSYTLTTTKKFKKNMGFMWIAVFD